MIRLHGWRAFTDPDHAIAHQSAASSAAQALAAIRKSSKDGGGLDDELREFIGAEKPAEIKGTPKR